MPLQPLFAAFEPLVRKAFKAAIEAAGESGASIKLEIHEAPLGKGGGRAEFAAIGASGPVRVTWAAIASLWALSQGSARLSRRMFDAGRAGARALSIAADPELKTGLFMYDFARQLCSVDPPLEANGSPHWPDWAVRPDVLPAAGSDDETGNNFLNGAVHWILAHEVSHISLRHERRSISESLSRIDQEREADAKATEWFAKAGMVDDKRALGRKPSASELALEFRGIALGLGLIWVALYEREFGTGAPNGSHPSVAQRLFDSLERLGLREDSAAAEILASIVHSWLAPGERWDADRGHLTAKDALDEALYQLQRRIQDSRKP